MNMRLLKKIRWSSILLVVILLLALGLRVNQLNRIPVGMTDDELREGYSAYSLWKTGRGLTSDTLFPFMFIVNNFSFNPVPIYISAPFVGLLGISMFTIRLPYMLAGFFALAGTYLLVRRLIQRESVSILAAFVMAVNVWAIHLSRMAYEAVFAQVFYIWSAYVFLSDWKKHAVRSTTIAMGLLFLAFNSYDAMKILYVPFLAILIAYKWKEIKKQRILWVVIAGWVIVTVVSFGYFYALKNPTVRGSGFTIFQNTAAAAQSVELARRTSSAPGFLKILYHNKFTYFADLFLHHYLFAYSWDYLFLNQEASGIYSLWSRGNLYWLEIPLLLFGALSLFAQKRRVFYFSLGALLISALPAGIGPEPFTYATRASFMIPWLAMWIGAGILFVVESAKKRFWKTGAVVLIAGMYLYFIGGYLHQYYFEWPRTGAVYFSKGIEDLVAYLAPKRGYTTIMVAHINDTFILHWALFNHTDIRLLRQHYTGKNPFVFGPIVILKDCLPIKSDDPRTVLDGNSVYVASPGCHKQKPDHIISLPDGQEQWYVYLGS